MVIHTQTMAATGYRFNGSLYGKRVYKRVAEEQTNRLIKYAEEEIVRIVDTKGFSNETSNLTDSYVWCVYQDGKRKGFGFYGNKQARKDSFLHEYSPKMRVPVNGRQLARKFAMNYKSDVDHGWEIVFAAVAPYGAYMDLKEGYSFHGKKLHFDVLSQRYDHIKNALSPLCKVTFEIDPPKY